MLTIETARLIFASIPLNVMKTRLTRDDFLAAVPVCVDHDGRRVNQSLPVHFMPEWPADPLGLYPHWIAQREAQPDRDDWNGIIIDRNGLVAVGGMGFKGLPDESGIVELGYNVIPSYQGRGYVTEMAQALVSWALGQPTVRRVTAECLEDNAASIRVLEKSGFVRIGRRLDDERPLLLWERKP